MPSLVAYKDENDVNTEVIAKLSGNCDRRTGNLCAEVVGALLARDLNLNVPEACLIEFSSPFIRTITDPDIRALAERSSIVGFGSRRLPQGFRAWIAQQHSSPMLQMAVNIFSFDAFIENADRRMANSNLLTDGEQIVVYDHELAFISGLTIIGRKPPWKTGALDYLGNAGENRHVFYDSLKGQALDFTAIKAAWTAITDQRLDAYVTAIPPEWVNESAVWRDAVSQIAGIRDNMTDCLAEVARVLK